MRGSDNTVREESKTQRRIPVDVPGRFAALSSSVMKSDESKLSSESVLLRSSANSSPDASETVETRRFRGTDARDVDAKRRALVTPTMQAL